MVLTVKPMSRLQKPNQTTDLTTVQSKKNSNSVFFHQIITKAEDQNQTFALTAGSAVN